MRGNDEGDPQELNFDQPEVTTRWEETHIRLDKFAAAAQALILYKFRALNEKDEKAKKQLWVKYYAAEKRFNIRREELLEILDV